MCCILLFSIYLLQLPFYVEIERMVLGGLYRTYCREGKWVLLPSVLVRSVSIYVNIF